MAIKEIRRTPNAQVGHAGLALIGIMVKICGLVDLAQELTLSERPQIQDWEIMTSLCGLLAQGKTDFDHIREFKEDEFFKNALGINRIPSAETLRQRFQTLALRTDLAKELPKCSIALWKKTGMTPDIIEKNERKWVRIDIDTSIFDNQDTQKEGAEYTYNNRFGFAPIFAYLGGGWMVNAALRPGNAHSYSAGTREFISESLDYAKKMVGKTSLLAVMDSGFDSQDLIRSLYFRKGTDFIIKHNLRKESSEEWLKIAKEKAKEQEQVKTKRENGILYRGSISKVVEGIKEPVRMVFEVTEIKRKNNRLLLVPEIRVNCFWTSLGLCEADVIKIYRERGTSEQYHSEFKSEMDMERLPSGKFKVNSAFLLLGMLVYNMLRIISKDMVMAKALGLRKASRRRLKTVIGSVLFMCGRITRHARRYILQLSCPKSWYKFFRDLFSRLQEAY